MEIIAGEIACYRILGYISLKMEMHWSSNPVGKVRKNLHFFKEFAYEYFTQKIDSTRGLSIFSATDSGFYYSMARTRLDEISNFFRLMLITQLLMFFPRQFPGVQGQIPVALRHRGNLHGKGQKDRDQTTQGSRSARCRLFCPFKSHCRQPLPGDGCPEGARPPRRGPCSGKIRHSAHYFCFQRAIFETYGVDCKHFHASEK